MNVVFKITKVDNIMPYKNLLVNPIINIVMNSHYFNF